MSSLSQFLLQGHPSGVHLVARSMHMFPLRSALSTHLTNSIQDTRALGIGSIADAQTTQEKSVLGNGRSRLTPAIQGFRRSRVHHLSRHRVLSCHQRPGSTFDACT